MFWLYILKVSVLKYFERERQRREKMPAEALAVKSIGSIESIK